VPRESSASKAKPFYRAALDPTAEPACWAPQDDPGPLMREAAMRLFACLTMCLIPIFAQGTQTDDQAPSEPQAYCVNRSADFYPYRGEPCKTSISRMIRGGNRQPSYLRKTKREGSHSILRSCQTCCANPNRSDASTAGGQPPDRWHSRREPGKATWHVETNCPNRLHGELLRIVGATSSAHIFGTLVPVEEPSTASIADMQEHATSTII
jgi:hypothetical protein